jgi:hypothetical protein
MKKIVYAFFSLLVLITLFLTWSTFLTKESIKSRENDSIQEHRNALDKREVSQISTLNSEEEAEINKLLPRVMAWAYRWRINLSCYQDSLEETQTKHPESGEKWVDKYKRAENSEVRTKVEVFPKQIIAYIEQLGIKVRFNRINGTKLEMLRPEQICSSVPEKAKDYVIKLPTLASSSIFSVEDEDAKKRLYERIVKLVKENACLSLSNSTNNEVIHIAIPNFNLGDPEIYVLLQGGKSEYFNGLSVDWIGFELNNQDREFYPKLNKNFGLPDEVAPFVKLIKQNQIGSFQVSCIDPNF